MASERCRNVPQKENFENKCQECGRQFTSPHSLKEHRRYICIQQATDEEDEGKINETDNYENQEEKNEHESMRQDIQETKNMPICNKTTINNDNKRTTNTDETDDNDDDNKKDKKETMHKETTRIEKKTKKEIKTRKQTKKDIWRRKESQGNQKKLNITRQGH